MASDRRGHGGHWLAASVIALLVAGAVIVAGVKVTPLIRGPRVIPAGYYAAALALSPDGQTLYIANYSSADGENPGDSLTVIAVPSGKIEKTIDVGALPNTPRPAGGLPSYL
jgi:DNA-binding beta-propeller fold protein YncE